MRRSARLNNKPKANPAVGEPALSFAFEAIGTNWWIGLYEPLPERRLAELKRVINQRIESFDQAYSRFRADSLVSAIAKKAGTYQLPSDAEALLAFYERLYEITNGAVTPLVGQALADAGYDASYSLRPKTISRVPAWEDRLSYSGGRLTAAKPVLLDFGAAGKGYLVDIISDLLETAGVAAYCVDAGGDMLYRHPSQPLTVGLEHPNDPSLAIGVARLANQSLCGSAGNRRAWAGYHHILNPHTRVPARDVKAAWVIADNTMLADGLATALFFVPPERLLGSFNFAYLRVLADNSLDVSANFPGEIFT